MSDLELAYTALAAKQGEYKKLWDYYDGDHPLVYSAQRLREVFQNLNTKFIENWCAVVVDSALERIQLERMAVTGDEAASTRLAGLWKQTEMDLDADDAHLAALVTGEAFVVVWPDEAGMVQAYYNDPRLCHLQYDAENPRRVAWGAKWWMLDSGQYRLTLYYPERLEYFGTRKKAESVQSYKAFEPLDPPVAENPYGQVPMFHLRRERRKVSSELTNVVSLQAAANKLLADMMVSAEFGAFKQRWVISNAEIGTLKNAPNEVWDIPAGDGVGQQTSVGELTATDLGNFTEAIEDVVGAISAISRTPYHYFFRGSGNVPSGEALIALEAPLNKKCARYINRFSNTWQRVGAFLLFVAGGAQVAPELIRPVFAEPATVQPRTRAEVREIRVRAGEPLVTVLRDQGYSEAYIERLVRDRREEQAAAQESLAQALLEQQRRFDQGE